MTLADNIKKIREERGFKQIEVANHISVDKSAYSKIEKGLRNITVEELQKMASLFSLTIDQIVNFEGDIPQPITLEDKSSNEQMRLIQQLDEKHQKIIMNLIEIMLSQQKFQDFVKQNFAAS